MARCEARLSKDYLRARRGMQCDGRCRRVADYIYDDQKLCAEHTSLKLLADARERGDVAVCKRKPSDKEHRDEAARSQREV